MLFVCHPKILHKYFFQCLLGPFQLPRQTEDNAYAKFRGDKQRALWYVMVFSGAVTELFTLFNPESVALFDKPCISFENFAEKFNSLRKWLFQFAERANKL